MKQFFIIFFLLLLFLSFISFISFASISQNIDSENFNSSTNTVTDYFFSNEDFCWPVPGYHTITSTFGKRTSPTSGASSNHSGIDIAAPEGTNIYSVISGTVIHTGFYGANGHTIIIKNGNLQILYCHVSPNYIIHNGNFIEKGQLISHVGPKYITDVLNNPYKDKTGKSTNGATTGCHLHLTIKKDNVAVNPLLYF